MIVSQRWGISVRPHHFPEILDSPPRIVEVVADNYLFKQGGPLLEQLDLLGERTAIALHGVGLNIAGVDPLDKDYVMQLRDLADRTRAVVVSDHLCFTSFEGRQSYDLLPPLLNKACVSHVAERVEFVQQTLGRQLALENVSSYVQPDPPVMRESEFFDRIVEITGCGVLLDLNNLFVNGWNHGFDPRDELRCYPASAVAQYHIAGHVRRGPLCHDTHDQPVCLEVQELLGIALGEIGHRPIILERDDSCSLANLREELDAIRQQCTPG